MKLEHYGHGEVNFFQVEKLPTNLQKIEIKENFFIVGESETHGNDHRVAVMDKVEFFRDQFERLYLKNDVETTIYCPNGDRHDTMKLPAGIWEIDKSLETDPLTQKLRYVAD